MGSGNLRNEKCYCGSGKKYKNCHLNKQPEWYAIENALKNKMSLKKCLAPIDYKVQCSKKIIRAHTISKSSNLKAIAENGHILTMSNVFENIKNDNPFLPLAKKVGINQASTHNMFCEKHDKELFSVLENQKIIFSNEQIFKLTYRNICKELFEKYNITNSKNEVFEQLINSYETYKIYQDGTKIGIRDLEYIKNLLDNDLLKSNFDNIKFYVIIFNENCPIMTSCAFLPHKDFHKNMLLDAKDEAKYYNYISFSILALEQNKSAIVFSWLHKDKETDIHCEKFIKSLNIILPNKQKCGAILNFLFTFSENIYFSEKWWNSLTQEMQIMIRKCAGDLTQDITLAPKNFDIFGDIFNLSIKEIISNI